MSSERTVLIYEPAVDTATIEVYSPVGAWVGCIEPLGHGFHGMVKTSEHSRETVYLEKLEDVKDHLDLTWRRTLPVERLGQLP